LNEIFEFMHLADGFLPATVCIGGYGVTGLCTWYSLNRIYKKADPTAYLPKASLLTATFFVASLINIPIPPGSIHLILNGLLGVVLGFFSFPAILIGLILQAIVFGHGGFSTLGVNAAMMGIPALLAHGIFQGRAVTYPYFPVLWSTAFWGGLAGALGLGLSILIFVIVTVLSIPHSFAANLILQEKQAILIVALSHLPLMAIEGLFTAFIVVFLERVQPSLISSTRSSW
jgi:cobalt/nickel transport system permease protein